MLNVQGISMLRGKSGEHRALVAPQSKSRANNGDQGSAREDVRKWLAERYAKLRETKNKS